MMRYEYVLSPKGLFPDLYGVLLTMADWGDKHVYGVQRPDALRPQDLRPSVHAGFGLHEACGVPG